MATRTLAVLNQKGGVGKTTTCVNLGAALARRGLRVLLVDMDPQANLTVHLGLEPPRLQRTTYSLLIGQHGLAEAVHETGVPGLFVVPSTLALANAEIQLAATVGRELVLREALESWLDPSAGGGGLPFAESDEARRPAADFVIIDCPPSLGTLTMNALCAAGEVLLPIQTEFFALQGVAGILESVRAVQRLNRGLRLSLVVPSLVDLRTTLSRDVIEEVRTYFPGTVTTTLIRKNVKLAEAPSHGKTIFEYDARCNGARDYEALAAEVLGEAPPEGAFVYAAERDDAPTADDETADEDAPDADDASAAGETPLAASAAESAEETSDAPDTAVDVAASAVEIPVVATLVEALDDPVLETPAEPAEEPLVAAVPDAPGVEATGGAPDAPVPETAPEVEPEVAAESADDALPRAIRERLQAPPPASGAAPAEPREAPPALPADRMRVADAASEPAARDERTAEPPPEARTERAPLSWWHSLRRGASRSDPQR